MIDRRHRTVCAIVSEASAKIMVKREGWTRDPIGHKIDGKMVVGVRKTFDSNTEIVAELDAFENSKVTAWVEP